MELDFNNFANFNEQQKLKHLLRLALLAPSSHNTQPWLFKVNRKTLQITITANWERQLKDSDPQGRELFLSLGTAVENFETALKAYHISYHYEEKKSAKGPEGHFTIHSLESGNTDITTLTAIYSRQANRYPFTKAALPENFIRQAESYASADLDICFITEQEPEKKQKLSAIILEAVAAAFHDKKFTRELSQWIKPSLKRYRDGMPGYNIGVPWLFSLFMPYAIRHIPMAGMQRAMNKQMLDHCPALAVIATRRDDPQSWFMAGRVYERVALLAESQNIKIGVFGAPVEIGDYYKQVQCLCQNNLRPQMVFRLGYTDKTPPRSPRLHLHSVIIGDL